ncbi:valine--tRNA ligase [Pelagibacterium xiamenense]|uniref:valine--tRNA ligase n=1 Tax=Pelagibacterium xiamenense TaxID=2901140 RepID=UPI001E582388|nr:valine--tRNA ligase [Pelagibacterium xiamenense]MCD7061066.1 valine--tRNA ligase [Pelagibacterium xiamenense]
MIEKTYEPATVEGRIYEEWEAAGAFAAGAGKKPGADSYTIVIPPPNVTGSLHVGHALNNTIQDILVRFERMRGKDVLWQPGMDHAGIATQMIVERRLMEAQQPTRRELGREKFLEKVWEWKAESGGNIFNQLKRLGASCDWSRERFTMDEGLSKAVLKVFVQLYKEGLIYRDKRLVNWHPGLQTAVSDLEVENIDVKGHMWHLRYPLADGVTFEFPVAFDEEGRPTEYETRDHIVVATTRPETMLGDVAVAVHPEDERYAPILGKFVELPIVGRRIPIIADEYSDPEKGTGAVKITPAHDFNDFEVGARHGLEPINIFTTEAAINENGPETYQGLDRFAARSKVVEHFENAGLLVEVETKVIAVPHDEKSKQVVIEPYLTDQWFVNAAELAKPALASVKEGRTSFVPKNWENTYFSWLENIQPWCVSRQLWWGHQIPAWYGPDGHYFVETSEEEALASARAHYGQDVELTRDPDVLDTWFSSALWPFSTLGWPDQTPELERYYPTNVLVTAFDIIFFWVARMMMFGLHFMGTEPFSTVYVHALVRDEHGQKMSKTKGNVIDPLELIESYGADAMRFTLAAMAAQGRDIKLAISRVEGYRNFVTKLWNAARFLEMNECVRVDGFDPRSVETSLNQWIVGSTSRAVADVTRSIEGYKFNEAANYAYDFVWGTFCDWYVELAKPVFSGDDARAKAETRASAAWALDQILKMLHPFMPFVTEELWAETGKVGPARAGHLMLSEWPELNGLDYPEASAELGWLLEVISAIRSVRTEMNVPAGAKVPLVVVGGDATTKERIGIHESAIARLGRVAQISGADTPPDSSALFVVGEATWALPLADLIDINAEKSRLAKDIKKLDGEITGLEKKLGNEQFLAKAPDEVVEEQRSRLAEAVARREKLENALERLS